MERNRRTDDSVGIETEFFHSGRVIAHPSPTTTHGIRTDCDSTYFFVRTAFRLPYLYNSNGLSEETFNYSYGFCSPELFGDDNMHDVRVNLYDLGNGVEVNEVRVDMKLTDFTNFTTVSPYSIAINWNEQQLLI